MKTSDEIATSVFHHVVESLQGNISGEVYNEADRPLNALTEDIVIRVIANMTSQRQEATINVNIYVPDVLRGKDYVPDGERMPFLQKKAMLALERFFADEALVILESQTVMPSINGREHVINNRLNYQYINDK